jgi:hypothetical protein
MDYRPVQFLMSGNPSAANGTAYFYETGTLTGKTMYDEDSSSIGTSIVLDAYGSAGVYGTGLVRVIIKDSDDIQIADYDNLDIDIGGWPSGHFYDIFVKHGARTSAALSLAITAVGSDEVNLYFDDGAWSITDNHTIDAASRVVMHPDAVLTISSGKTLQFDNDDTSGIPPTLHFAGSGTAFWQYGRARTNPIWWRSDYVGGSNSDAVNSAITASAGITTAGGIIDCHHGAKGVAGGYVVGDSIIPVSGVGFIGTGMGPTTGYKGTRFTRLTGASGPMFETTGTADYVDFKDLVIDCDFKGTDGIKVGFNTNAWIKGSIENVEVIDCAGIGIHVTASNSNIRNAIVVNADGGGVGTHQVKILGSDCNIYNLVITGEAGSTANIELAGDNINIYGLYIEDPNLTKAIRFTGDNNHIYGCHIKTEDNTKTYTQLFYFESGATGNLVQGVEIEKGATDTITNSVQDDQYSTTIAYDTNFNEYHQIARHAQIVTLDDSATPSVAGGNIFHTGGTTAITDFADAIVGQQIVIIAKHSVTITNGSPIQLSGGSSFNMVSDDTLTLIQDSDGVWYQTAKSDNT